MSGTPKYPPFETRDRMRMWCDMQERAHFDVRKKLQSWNVASDDIEQIVSELISNNYLNEERFAIAFASGKFRIKKWGWNKIVHALKQKQVSAYSIALAKEELQSEEVQNTLHGLLKKKVKFVKANSQWELKQKLMRFAAGRGYSFEEINRVLDADFFE